MSKVLLLHGNYPRVVKLDKSENRWSRQPFPVDNSQSFMNPDPVQSAFKLAGVVQRLQDLRLSDEKCSKKITKQIQECRELEFQLLKKKICEKIFCTQCLDEKIFGFEDYDECMSSYGRIGEASYVTECRLALCTRQVRNLIKMCYQHDGFVAICAFPIVLKEFPEAAELIFGYTQDYHFFDEMQNQQLRLFISTVRIGTEIPFIIRSDSAPGKCNLTWFMLSRDCKLSGDGAVAKDRLCSAGCQAPGKNVNAAILLSIQASLSPRVQIISSPVPPATRVPRNNNAYSKKRMKKMTLLQILKCRSGFGNYKKVYKYTPQPPGGVKVSFWWV